jgi:cation transport ATPase
MGEQSQRQATQLRDLATKIASRFTTIVWLASLLAMCFWLLFAGTPFWQHSSSFYSNLVFMVAVPAMLAVSSIGIIVLRTLSGQQHAQAGSCSQLAARLLPPR